MHLTGPYVYRATLLRVIDADTYEMVVDLGFLVSIKVNIRLRDYSAPERFTAEGKAASAFVRRLLDGKLVHIKTYRDRRSFERWVADVYIEDESEHGGYRSLGEILLRDEIVTHTPRKGSDS